MAKNVIRSHNTVLLHRQMIRGKFADRGLILFVALFIVVAFVFGGKYIGLAKYSEGIAGVFSGDNDETLESTEVDLSNEQPGPIPGSDGSAASGASPGGASSGAAPAAAAPPSAPAAAAPAASVCGNAAIPAAACTAILAIEQGGPKNNPAVAMDTSQIPDGSTISIDKATWSGVGTGQGTASFTISVSGQQYAGVLTLQDNGGSWQAVGYELNE